MPLFSLALLILVLLVFLQAALHKLFDLTELRGFVADYRLLPEFLVTPAAYTLVVLEVAVVVLCVVAATRPFALILALFLLALYAAAIAINLARGLLQIECGCGAAAQRIGPHLLVRNGILMMFALIPLWFPPTTLAVTEILFAGGAGVFLWLIYQFCERATANWQMSKYRRPQAVHPRGNVA